jgi:hypothetical protein
VKKRIELEMSSSERERKKERERIISVRKGSKFTIPRLISTKMGMENMFSVTRTPINLKERTQ